MSLILLLIAAQSLPTQPQPALHLHNPSPLPQQCVLTASLPLPRPWGARSLLGLRVGDANADWAPLLRWADGTLAVVQLQWSAALAAGETTRVLVHCVPSPDDPRAPAAGPQVASAPWILDLPLHTEVVDPWGRAYVARLSAPDQTRRGAVQQLHWVAPHVHAATGAAFLTTEIYLTRSGDEPFGELTVVLNNARGGEPAPIGPARLARFSLITADSRLRLRPHDGYEHLLPQPTMERGPDGVECGFRQDLLGPSEMLFLGDGTAKVFRFDVCFNAGLSASQLAAIEAHMSAPPSAFADLEWVRFTGAFGMYGGPAPVVSAADDLAVHALTAWRHTAQFGPFGGFGNVKEAAAVGYAHNTPTALHNVLRWRSSALLRVAQARAMQAALRPLPGRRPCLPAQTSDLRQGLSARAVERPHGFAALGYEHANVDVLLELFWLTGDPWARDELARQGVAIRALLQRLPFMTSRGEGQCAQALAAVGWATADDELLAWAVRRLHEHVLPRLSQSAVAALAQPPHPEVLGGDAWFDAPWQMAVLVHGLCALHRRTDDPGLAGAAVDVARKMATLGFVDGVGPKYFVHAGNSQRFCLPVGFAPLHGTATLEIGAFVLAAELARDDAATQHLLEARAKTIVAAARDSAGLLPPAVRANAWFQVWLDRNQPAF